MKTSSIRQIFNLLFLCLFWISSYANMVFRHYTVHMSFNNKVSNTSNQVELTNRSVIACSAMCGEDCFCFGFHSQTRRCCVFHACYSEDITDDEFGWNYYVPELPVDCQELFESGETTSGVYVIRRPGERRMATVYCDMATSGGGWTVIQNRVDGTVDFNRSWEEYKTGFGDVSTSYWIGNAIIHQLTKDNGAYLYISITDVNETSLYILYDEFSILGEDHKYRLNISGAYSGSLDDSIRNTYTDDATNAMNFSTFDQDNDNSTKNCAGRWGGGWWFNDCSDVFPNGPYDPSKKWIQPWDPPFADDRDVARTRMMIKRRRLVYENDD